MIKYDKMKKLTLKCILRHSIMIRKDIETLN